MMLAPGPVLVLVNPQDIVNIASAVRIARNFGIERMRLVDPEMNRMMAQYVLLAVLRYHRDFPAIEEARRAKRWQYVHPRESATCSVGIMGLGNLGSTAAAELLRQGFGVAGWSATPKTMAGVATSSRSQSISGWGANFMPSVAPTTRSRRPR